MKTTESIQVGWYVADLVVDVSARLDGELKDWPKHMQDQVYAAIEALDERTGRSYEVLRSFCDWDDDHKWFVHVTVRAPKRVDIRGITH